MVTELHKTNAELFLYSRRCRIIVKPKTRPFAVIGRDMLRLAVGYTIEGYHEARSHTHSSGVPVGRRR